MSSGQTRNRRKDKQSSAIAGTRIIVELPIAAEHDSTEQHQPTPVLASEPPRRALAN
jgi:hypothetical protein